MIIPQKPSNENVRLAAVQEFNLLDTLPEQDYDSITSLAASICDVPVSLVTLMHADRNFLKSHFGVDYNEAPRDKSFCGHALLDESDIFIVEDARKDLRFVNNPIVTENQAVFYAGVRLLNKDGLPLGTLCVLDKQPRTLDAVQKKALISLARQVINLFEARQKNKELEKIQIELKEKNNELRNFAGIISHDMKMPLANMIVTSDIIKAKYSNLLDEQGIKYLNYLKQSSFTLSEYISGILSHYESDKIEFNNSDSFDLHHLLEEIVDLLNINIDCEINFPEINVELNCNRSALEQIFLNLIGNSLKYNEKDKIIIEIDCEERDSGFYFKISDNGMGIPEDQQKEIFKLFTTIGNLDRNGQKGNGIGLSTVQKLVNGLGGNITVKSQLGKGSTFEFNVTCQ